jgi:HEAT repeat protein
MWKKRLLVGMAVLLTVLLCVVFLDPTSVLLGRLSGESFYQGRPTTYWSRQLRTARAEAIAKATAAFSPSPSPSSWPSWTGSTPPPPPLPPWMLSRLVKEPDSELLRTRDETAVPVLLELLRDNDPWVRWRAAVSLSVILESLPREKVEGLGDRQLDRLVSTLEEGLLSPFDERCETGQALARLSLLIPSALPPLVRFLRNKTNGVGNSGEQLYLLLRHSNDPILAKLGNVLVPFLNELLGSEDLKTRQDACSLLAAFGSYAQAAVPALHTALADRDLRVAAAEALWRIEPGNGATLPALIQQLQDGDFAQRLEAVNALGRLGSHAAPAVLPLLGVLREMQSHMLPKEKEPGGILLIEEADGAAVPVTEEDCLAAAILTALRHMGPTAREAIPALADQVRCLHRPMAFDAAVETLHVWGPEARAAVPVLVAVLPHVSGERRYCVAQALACIGPQDRTAVLALTPLLRDPRPGTRIWGARALGSIGPEASPAIHDLASLLGMALTEEQRFDIQDEAFSTLEKIGAAAIPALEAAQDDADPEVRRRAVKSLNKIKEQAR